MNIFCTTYLKTKLSEVFFDPI